MEKLWNNKIDGSCKVENAENLRKSLLNLNDNYITAIAVELRKKIL
jgi:hypothetical protein